MENPVFIWWIFAALLTVVASILFLGMLASTVNNNLRGESFTRLCLTGFMSAVAQAILLWHISFESELLFFSLYGLTALGFLAGALVLRRLHVGRISSSTADHLLLVGQVVYPAFLLIFMFWSWETGSL